MNYNDILIFVESNKRNYVKECFLLEVDTGLITKRASMRY
jgi:hypothetical protein